MQKLQERLVSSVKITDAELLDIYHQRFDRVAGTVVQVPPADGERRRRAMPISSAPTRSTATGSRPALATQAEVLRVPKDFGEDEDSHRARSRHQPGAPHPHG
jgi:hypothetical protein